MNFTLSPTYGKARDAREYETSDDLAPARGIRNGLLIVLPVWIVIGCAIWSLCK